MRSLIIAGAVAAAIAFTIGMDFADAAVSGLGYAQSQTASGYRIGAGEAHIGDGSSPGYYAPVFSGGTGG